MKNRQIIMRVQEVLDCGNVKCGMCRDKLNKLIKQLKEREQWTSQ